MLLRALAATSAEGWEEEDEKLRSRVDVDRIENVVGANDDDGEEGPLKQPALPSTFGSFLSARGTALAPPHVLHAEDAKGRGKRREREKNERTEKRKQGGDAADSTDVATEREREGRSRLLLALFSNPNSTKKKNSPRNPKPASAGESKEKLPSAKRTALSDSLAAAKGRFLPSSPSPSASAAG